MKLINTNDVYYDNDFERWYFENDEDFENAQVVDDNYVKENQELKQQLVEKDKIIETLEKDIKSKDCVIKLYSTIASTNTTKMNIAKEIRKRVCDEIREQININCRWDELGHIVDLYWHDLNNILDQIEKENAIAFSFDFIHSYKQPVKYDLHMPQIIFYLSSSHP